MLVFVTVPPKDRRRLKKTDQSDPNLVQYQRPTLSDMKSPESGPKLSANPQSAVFSKSANPPNVSKKSAIRELFQAKYVNPRTYSPPSVGKLGKSFFRAFDLRTILHLFSLYPFHLAFIHNNEKVANQMAQ